VKTDTCTVQYIAVHLDLEYEMLQRCVEYYTVLVVHILKYLRERVELGRERELGRDVM